jgi:hypothetical protein
VIKNCKKGEVCSFSQYETTQVPLPDYLTINNDTKPFKQINYPLICSEVVPPSIPNDTHYSSTCTIMVSIVGKNKLGTGSIKFELSVEDDMDSHFMTLNQFSFIR